jgi:hypothetical protein
MHAWTVRGVFTLARLELFSLFMKLLNNVYSNFNEIVTHVSFLVCGRDHVDLIVSVMLVPVSSEMYL